MATNHENTEGVREELPEGGLGHRLGRTLGFALLNLYLAALLIAAWPNGEDFGPLRPIHQASRDLFDILKTRSASYVFSGNRGAWKRKSLCIVAVGTDSKGMQQTLYETYPACVVPATRLFEDPFYVLLMRIGYGDEMKPLLGASLKKREEEVLKLQRSSSMDSVSRYFCSSRLVGRASLGNIKRVDLFWDTEQINYQTSKRRRHLLHAHGFDCGKDRRISHPERRFDARSEPLAGLFREQHSTRRSKASSPPPSRERVEEKQ